ncbi:MAG TPA: beta-N-acetylhexosaminidase [bacterium]|nr:beta-N-acetylhexosaminidase [bacterium]
MAPGCLMIDLQGLRLGDEEAEQLRHPQVGGLILFARNYQNPAQLQDLVAQVRNVRPELLIAVDHEGGRVQRFREGFTLIPAASKLGELYDQDRVAALQLARDWAWLLASELRAFDIDLSFAPVLDLGGPLSRVIGDRALHEDPDVIAALGAAWMLGMRDAGMAAVGKHFPGHGSVAEDSHLEFPLDPRALHEIEACDLRPFRSLIDAGLPGMMLAHVIYPTVDALPAGFSSVWVRELLRERYGFAGAIFTDDLSMVAATRIAEPLARVRLALEAGCDMLLLCNRPQDVAEVLADLDVAQDAARASRVLAMRATGAPLPLHDLRASERFRSSLARMQAIA